jgi:hypothetical protein
MRKRKKDTNRLELRTKNLPQNEKEKRYNGVIIIKNLRFQGKKW